MNSPCIFETFLVSVSWFVYLNFQYTFFVFVLQTLGQIYGIVHWGSAGKDEAQLRVYERTPTMNGVIVLQYF